MRGVDVLNNMMEINTAELQGIGCKNKCNDKCRCSSVASMFGGLWENKDLSQRTTQAARLDDMVSLFSFHLYVFLSLISLVVVYLFVALSFLLIFLTSLGILLGMQVLVLLCNIIVVFHYLFWFEG